MTWFDPVSMCDLSYYDEEPEEGWEGDINSRRRFLLQQGKKWAEEHGGPVGGLTTHWFEPIVISFLGPAAGKDAFRYKWPTSAAVLTSSEAEWPGFHHLAQHFKKPRTWHLLGAREYVGRRAGKVVEPICLISFHNSYACPREIYRRLKLMSDPKQMGYDPMQYYNECVALNKRFWVTDEDGDEL